MSEKGNFNSQEARAYFMREVPNLLAQTDIFGDEPRIIQVGSSQLSLTTVDSDRHTVRNAFFVKGPDGFEIMDVEHIYNPFEDGVLKAGVLCNFNTKK